MRSKFLVAALALALSGVGGLAHGFGGGGGGGGEGGGSSGPRSGENANGCTSLLEPTAISPDRFTVPIRNNCNFTIVVTATNGCSTNNTRIGGGQIGSVQLARGTGCATQYSTTAVVA